MPKDRMSARERGDIGWLIAGGLFVLLMIAGLRVDDVAGG